VAQWSLRLGECGNLRLAWRAEFFQGGNPQTTVYSRSRKQRLAEAVTPPLARGCRPHGPAPGLGTTGSTPGPQSSTRSPSNKGQGCCPHQQSLAPRMRRSLSEPAVYNPTLRDLPHAPNLVTAPARNTRQKSRDHRPVTRNPRTVVLEALSRVPHRNGTPHGHHGHAPLLTSPCGLFLAAGLNRRNPLSWVVGVLRRRSSTAHPVNPEERVPVQAPRNPLVSDSDEGRDQKIRSPEYWHHGLSLMTFSYQRNRDSTLGIDCFGNFFYFTASLYTWAAGTPREHPGHARIVTRGAPAARRQALGEGTTMRKPPKKHDNKKVIGITRYTRSKSPSFFTIGGQAKTE